MFDDGSRVMVEDNEEYAVVAADRESSSSSLQPTQRGTIPLHSYYEIDRMSREVVDLLVVSQSQSPDETPQHEAASSNSRVSSNNSGTTILRVALQFPDELLEDSPEVCWLLEDKMREDLEALPSSSTATSPATTTKIITPFCFILGDTTVNSCCPDEVAALHLNADVLIHYGHACLSPTGTLPVLYSFGKLDFDDLDVAVEELQDARSERKKNAAATAGSDHGNGENNYNNYLLLYQVGYHHAMKDLQERWMKEDGTLKVVVAEIPAPSRRQNQRARNRSNATANKTRTSCCQQSDASTDNAKTVAQSGGCCGGNPDSGSSPDIVQESSNPTDEIETSSSSCCRKEEEDSHSCNTPVPLPSSPANIVVGETETESESENGGNSNSPSFDQERRLSRPLVVGGLELPADQISKWEDLSDFTVVFIMGNPEEDADQYSTDDKTTPQQRQYANSMLCFLSLPHGEPGGGYWIYSPKNKINTLRTDVSPPPALKRQLKRRFFLTQKARDANVFGILVSNLSQQHLVDVVKSLQTIIQDSNRTAYSFAVGKINPSKLANFAEIDTFVIVACREHSLLDMEREYPIPVITPMELEIAMENLQWGMQPYSLDCQDVMIRQEEEEERKQREREQQLQLGSSGANNNEATDFDNDDNNDDNDNESVDSDAPYFSMVTGRYESRKQKGSRNDDLDLAALPGKGQVAEYKSEAANFLRQREYQGLESMVGQTEVKAAVLGMRGIASDYRNDETAS